MSLLSEFVDEPDDGRRRRGVDDSGRDDYRTERSASTDSSSERSSWETHSEACTWDPERVRASLTRRTAGVENEYQLGLGRINDEHKRTLL